MYTVIFYFQFYADFYLICAVCCGTIFSLARLCCWGFFAQITFIRNRTFNLNFLIDFHIFLMICLPFVFFVQHNLRNLASNSHSPSMHRPSIQQDKFRRIDNHMTNFFVRSTLYRLSFTGMRFLGSIPQVPRYDTKNGMKTFQVAHQVAHDRCESTNIFSYFFIRLACQRNIK